MQPPPALKVFEEMQKLVADCTEVSSGMSVGELTNKDMEEIRQLKNPPVVVRRTLEAVYLLMNAARAPARPQPPDWARVQRMLSDANFLSKMLNYDSAILQSSPVLTGYVASEYFGGSSGAEVGRRNSTGSLRPELRRSRTTGFNRRGSVLDEAEPLTFSRVFRASKAAAALFRWSALVIVQALEADLAPASPPAMEPVVQEQLPAPAPSAPAAPAPAPPPKPVPEPKPAPKPAPTAEPPAPTPNKPPERLPRPSPVAPEQTPERRVPKPMPPPAEPAQPKRVIPFNAEPDRHFELLSTFVFGSASLEQEGIEALQTVCATYCMRRRLQVELVSSAAQIENEALARGRLMVAQEWLVEEGMPPDAIFLSKERRTASEDPGVICLFHLKNDKVLRDFFLLVAQGETRKDAGTRDTIEIAKWLEENFECCMH